MHTLYRIAALQELGYHAVHVTLEALRQGVVDTVVHALLQPQVTLIVLHNLLGVVVAHGGGVTHVRVERLHTVAVIAVQTVARSYPHITVRVAENAIHLRIRQSVAGVQTLELYLRNTSLHSHGEQEKGNQQKGLTYHCSSTIYSLYSAKLAFILDFTKQKRKKNLSKFIERLSGAVNKPLC